MQITYRKVGNYQIPNLMIEKANENQFQGKYYQMRLNYLKENKKGLYMALIMKNKLTEHLQETQETATKRIEQIIKQLMIQENITEEMKQQDQMKWIQIMNNLKNSAEEIVVQELIYN